MLAQGREYPTGEYCRQHRSQHATLEQLLE